MAEQQLQGALRESEELKHSNQLLFQKSTANKERLDQVMQEVEDLKRYIDQEKARSAMAEAENKKLGSRVVHLEELLKGEKDRVIQKEGTIEELSRQREALFKEHADHLSQKMAEYDALKRGYDELHYESETLRRTINTKQEEVSGLNQLINQHVHAEDQLQERLRQMEETVQDVEEKNKRLVDLLNANIYSKAEQYKEKVMNRLLDRPASA